MPNYKILQALRFEKYENIGVQTLNVVDIFIKILTRIVCSDIFYTLFTLEHQS